LAVYFIIGTVLILLLLPYTANCQDYYVYEVTIRSDGSAIWTINQFSSASAPVETWEGFQQKIFDLLDSASSITHRTMDVDENSLQINTNISFESKTTEYSFIWQNFCTVEGNELSFGDVFQVPDFFNQLFGDAAMKVNYPETYGIESVNPPPHEQQDEMHTMEWARTQDLTISITKVTLTPIGQLSNDENQNQYIFIVLAIIGVGICISILGFYSFKKRKNNNKPIKTANQGPVIETDEDKILKILRNAGGTMRQSEITDSCGFSKAKTSQLLSALESNGNLTRYKKGRDKIVMLKEGANGD
jgi:uncharacterized membrane protein